MLLRLLIEIHEHYQKPILEFWIYYKLFLKNTKNAPIADLNKMLQGKRFGYNKEVIVETKAYFENKDESYYKKSIEKLEKRSNECITLKGNYVDE